LRRVKANKGSPGVDAMSVEELPEYLVQHWPAIRAQLLSGTYRLLPHGWTRDREHYKSLRESILARVYLGGRGKQCLPRHHAGGHTASLGDDFRIPVGQIS
jgi:hypothetical protein